MPSLTKKQFDILTCFAKDPDQSITPQEIAQQTQMSLPSVQKMLHSFMELELVEQGKITSKGLNSLEPHRVKRAVFIAAGFGSRLVPITLNTPKPLIRVNGVRMIDTLLDAVISAGIEEIIIVRGYLSEQFDQLLYKYPNIKFVENPIYNESNNISSIMCVRYQLRQAYVMEADLVLYNPKLITKYQYCSNYLGVPTDVTNDWCFQTKKGYISKLGIGGRNCHHMYGISYWSDTDGARLAEHIKQVYEMPGGKERYWDQVPLEYFLKEYKIQVRNCSFDDIVEIDTYKDLKKIDNLYQ